MEALLLALAVTLTIAILGTLLLFPRALYDTIERLLDASPAVVVRRVNATGWQPLPVQEALSAVRNVIGVVSVRPRVWGVVSAPHGPVTVLGLPPEYLARGYTHQIERLPSRGQALVGAGVLSAQIAKTITLEGAVSRPFEIIGRLPDQTSIFTHDLVLLNMADARQLIGLPEGYASDLAVAVFHEDEQSAILSDLTTAFPWPVQCLTRHHSAGMYASGLNRGSTLSAITVIPAVLAVCLLVMVNIRLTMGRQSELGIMKSMGWTTGTIVRLQLYRTLSVGLPSAAVGLGLALFMVYGPGNTWIGKVFLGWETLPPKLYLPPQGALTVLLEVAGLILVPVVVSALGPAIKSATTDAYALIEGINTQ